MEEKKQQLIIAIDGYSSCGKSTLAKAIAHQLHLLFIDTGAMYRAIALYAINNNIIDANGQINNSLLETSLPNIHVTFDVSESIENPTILLNNKNVQQEIRSTEVNAVVSLIAANSLVRKKMVEAQREIAQTLDIVMDGRDIGSVVFPNATVKFFLTASPEIRADRRFKELMATNPNFQGSLSEVKKNLLERDYIDSTRADSPLIQTPDAIVIDNSEMTMDEQLNIALTHIKSAIKK